MAGILLIDDDPELVRIMKRLLESRGHTVTEAADGETALQLQSETAWDLVITDIYMPRMDGIEFIIRLKKECPESRIIAMSGGGFLSTDRVLGAASMLGADAVLEKPFSAPEVLEAVELALEGR